MINNLVSDAWIPVLRQKGLRENIAPWQLTETNNPVISLDSPRPDFNGALMQFLIGLLQTTATPDNHDRWLDWLEEPPSPEVLKHHFSKYANAFELNAKAGSFMQDFESLGDSGFNNIADLLIESPGGNTVKENKDHFIKRGRIEAACSSCAATALFTLQTNAPSGGQGHRTSLRGGGPLTTLAVLDERSDLPNNLWRNLWLNVMDAKSLGTLTGNKNKQEPADIFPWLANTRTSGKEGGKETTPLDVNPLQMYWGMPRRIRIDWDTMQVGHCDICNTYSEQLVSQYQTKNYGVNYTGTWQHPLSPYSLNKTGELLPQHAQPGGMTYRHWLKVAIADHDKEPTYFNALVIARYRRLMDKWNAESDLKEQLRLYVFGYDMDNMKARCWYETTFPLLTIPDNIRFEFSTRIQMMTEAASEFAGFVRSCVKDAWFKRPGDAKGDTSFLTQSFYRHTELAFFEAAKQLQNKLQNGTDTEVLQAWHSTLLKASRELFDYWAARGDIAQANPRRVAVARDKLQKLAYSKTIKAALQLPTKRKPVSKPDKEIV